MKKTSLFWILIILLNVLASESNARVKLAEWKFDKVYSTATVGDTVVYTPTSVALTADPNITISNGKFKIAPDSSAFGSNQCYFNASTAYCQLKNGYNNFVSRLMFQGPSSVSDFSLSANHKNYYQVILPTTGYDSIAVSFSFAGGQNLTTDYLTMVYSVDNGLTWAEVGSYNSLSGWWLYKDYSATINARNKAKVIIRLITNTVSTSGSANFNLDNLAITGTVYSAVQTVNATTDITWPFNLGTADQVATYTSGTQDYFNPDYFTTGTNLKLLDKNTTNNITYTRFQPLTQAGGASDADAVTFGIRPKTGLKFKPSKVSFDCMRFGTDGGSIDVLWVTAAGTTTLQTAIKPIRNNNTTDSPHIDIDLSTLNIDASAGDNKLQIIIYGLGNTKQAGISNVKISGAVTGTLDAVATHTVTTEVTPAGAGRITSSPVGNSFDKGTEVTLTATRNFGYNFSRWINASGQTLSTESSFKFKLVSDTAIKAVFVPVNTYALKVSVAGGAKAYMISASPSATVVNNQNMYEEGTVVTLTASNNDILTFTNWENGETNAVRTISMTENKNITGTYSAIDYVAAWDFYQTGSGGRAADFASNTENEASTLNLRLADGTTSSWLDKSQVAAGGYEGVPAAVNWKPLADKYYYQIMVNAADFVDISVKSSMLLNYNAYSVQNIEYSTDGTNFTKAGTIQLAAAKVWYPSNVTIPAQANHAAKLYIRWIPDYTSEILGTTATNDGTSIAAIYVLGKKEVPNDGTAPVLLSSIPANKGTGASTTGKIVLNFDEKVQMANGTTATIGTKTLSPVVTGKTVTFNYTGLEYNSTYTFTLAGGKVADLAGNTKTDAITISFTTMTRPVVTKKKFDFVVGIDGDFKAALAAAQSAASSGNRFYIFFPNGEYNIGANTGDGNQMTTISLPNLSMVGQTADGVIIYNKSVQESINSTATIAFTGTSSNNYLQDLSLMNKMDYRTGTLVGRGVVLWDQGNKNIYKGVKLLSNQDTYYSGGSIRSYFENSEIHGTVDFICGGGDIFFNECLIYLEDRSGNCITAPATSTNWGYVFNNCTIDGFSANSNSYRLGRPWSNAPKAVYLNTTMKMQPIADGWGDPMNVVPAVFAEYNSMTTNGAAIDLSGRRKTYTKEATTVTLNPVLTAEQAATYTLENVVGGTDSWQPKLYTDQAAAPVIAGNLDQITWADNNFVLCWAVFKNNVFVTFVTTNSYAIPASTVAGSVFTVRAANEMGGLGAVSNTYTYSVTDVHNPDASAELLSESYFTPEGKKLNSTEGYHGIVIVRSVYSNGEIITKKIMKKDY
jgi:pectin methylesterase-like acyl-CoA thioesterase